MIQRRLGDGRIITLYPEIFGTARLLVEDNAAMFKLAERTGEPTKSDGFGADAYFQYPDMMSGLTALCGMRAGDPEPPCGWVRASPPHFRRRPGGRPELEFVAE